MNLSSLRNPVWRRSDNLRDPSVFKNKDGYILFYSRFSNNDWSKTENWSVASVLTHDFQEFVHDRDITPKGYASPGDLVYWGGRYILPLQSYPLKHSTLCYIESADLVHWSSPKIFLADVLDLDWNREKRAIDPTFVISADTLHCYFVGSDDASCKMHTNLIGHATTKDQNLEHWNIISKDAPLIGVSDSSPDGAENVAILKNEHEWIMIYSEGLVDQHLAFGKSRDLFNWTFEGRIGVSPQRWMDRKFGAPFVWKEENQWLMILMGHGNDDRTTLGLLTSTDGIRWNLLEEEACLFTDQPDS